MTLRTKSGHTVAESTDDLAGWLRALEGCPSVDRVVLAECRKPAHGEEPATWFYVEADPARGVARLRCLGCGDVRPVLDSAERWTYPPTRSCPGCVQSIFEVVFGLHVEGTEVSWLAVAVRCVNCNDVSGAADLVVAPPVDADALAASL
jgi:hypothetical protein